MLGVIVYVLVDIVINIFHYHVQASAAPDQYWSTSTARASPGAPPPCMMAPYWQRTAEWWWLPSTTGWAR